MINLKTIGVTCCVIVLAQHVSIHWWEGFLLGFGITALVL